MKKVLATACMILAMSFLGYGMGDRAMITIRVVEETGEPIPDATVRIGFFDDNGMHVGSTDTNGVFFAAGNPPTADVSYSISKDGYYWHGDNYHFSWTYDSRDKCDPWNPTNTIILKQIKSPVPMYAKRVEALIPVLDTPVGFDLEKGDWVSPCGGGREVIF